MAYQNYLNLLTAGLFNPYYNTIPFIPTSHFVPIMRPTLTIPSIPLTKGEPEIVSEDEDDEDERSLYIAHLDERITEEILYEIFLHAGPIEKAYIPKDNNGRQRSFGFITYKYRCSAPYAVKLYQGLKLYQKVLYIKFQGKPKTTLK